MEYTALTLGLTDELFAGIQSLLVAYKLRLLPTLTVNDASRLLNSQIFHLLIINLEYLRSIQQMDWLIGIRRISFVPLIVLSDAPEIDLHPMVQIGVDSCAPSKGPYSIIADMALSLLRRYTEYNHYNGPGSIEVSAFRVGDIFIDPPRRIVEVRGQKINLKHREFSLLLYFMRNPNIVLRQHRTTPTRSGRKWKNDPEAWGCPGSVAAGKADQAARQGLSARIRFARANTKFSLAVCFCSPRYRVFL